MSHSYAFKVRGRHAHLRLPGPLNSCTSPRHIILDVCRDGKQITVGRDVAFENICLSRHVDVCQGADRGG
ncbi:hypothetical protein E2C01_019824 [Portunus trituberculatus]|uniref:Uncharacterized protein n=1 Tax=Portunus trituberculatus TaxID=210409 RepID=A0A5B7E022_PORTR|nr:hypothetical protein [Portunus trituberculatus]